MFEPNQGRTPRLIYSVCMRWFRLIAAIAGSVAALLGADFAIACSRVLWADNGLAVMVGRNTDWAEDPRANLWAFPRGIARSGLSGDANSLAWTSKFGSVIASFYDLATIEGLNEKGLVAELLWLTETDYGKRDARLPGLSLSLWAQYMLDNFAAVDEAVAALEKGDYQIVPLQHLPGAEGFATVHLSLSDAAGDSALIEVVDAGKLRIYHDRKYTVMTNSPPFPQQLANLKRYHAFGGTEPLPGTNDPADRFVRAAYYVQKPPQAERSARGRRRDPVDHAQRRPALRQVDGSGPSGSVGDVLALRRRIRRTASISSNRRCGRTSSGSAWTVSTLARARPYASSISSMAAT